MIDHLAPWRGILPDQRLAAIERLAGSAPPYTIRLNTLRIDRQTALREWSGWQVEPAPLCPDALRLPDRPAGLGRSLEHRMGFFYIQDLASMLPGELFSPFGAEPLILDLAAAPGGKTTHLACKSADRGLIVANDVSGGRSGATLANLRRWGTTSAAVTALPGERFGKWFPETFDAALLDAPCSGDNLRNPVERGRGGGSKGRRVSARERRALHERQLRLLMSAFSAVRPGGEIVYSTCTVAPVENEAVLDEFLGRVGNAAEIVRPDRLADLPGGLPTINGQDFDPQVASAIRLWPDDFDTGAFFAALIRKRESLRDTMTEPDAASARRGAFEPLPAAERSRIAGALHAGYGFELDKLLGETWLELWHAGRLIHALPRALNEVFAALPVKAAGMLLGELDEGGFTPSHELVSRFFERFPEGRLHIPAEQVADWLAGRDLAGLDAPANRIVLAEDDRGRFLGRGRALAERVKPMLPAGF